MKITEVTKSATQALHEAIDQDNRTGFLTEDLVKIVEQDQSGAWSEPMSADDLLAEMDSWTA
jgi:hypothetical protein